MSASFSCEDPDSRCFRPCEATYQLCHNPSSSLSTTSSSFSRFSFLTTLFKTKQEQKHLSFRVIQQQGRAECGRQARVCRLLQCTVYSYSQPNVPVPVQKHIIQQWYLVPLNPSRIKFGVEARCRIEGTRETTLGQWWTIVFAWWLFIYFLVLLLLILVRLHNIRFTI